MRVMPFSSLMPSGRMPGLESPSAQGRGTKWSVAPEAVWQREERRALELRGREPSGALEQRKRPTMWEGRRPTGPEPERLKGASDALTVMLVTTVFANWH